ncbi:MAG: Stk1 family PASTA domain-containing Ser/Thr kinase [Lapillicoccus sp.]
MTSSVQESMVGRLLDGRYRVLSHIADGGMASVYLALDERLDREVAVKIMRRELVSDETFVTRFRREARSAARLSHPHVVAVYDQGADGADMFLAMEYVPGRTLREVITQEGPLTPRAALDIFDRILQALDAAHSAGLIHRDVKPENVIIRDDGVVKVADFGLARAVTAATTTNTSGTLLGTVAYLSPEQVERGIADARSDVYAAGLVLFEILTGRKAFHGDTPIHVAYQHVHGTVPAASSLVPSVPPELDQLIALGTARDPDQRPASAGDYLIEVRRSRSQLTTSELDLRPVPPLAGPAAAVPTTRIETSPEVHPTSVIPVDRADRASQPARAGTSPRPIGSAAPAPPAHHREDLDPERRRRWPAAVALLVVLLLAGAVGGWWFLAGPGAETLVPAVVKLDQAAAVQALQRADLTAAVTESFDETIPQGIVISTDPGAAVTVHKQSTVTITVSKGAERYAAPTLVGTSADKVSATFADGHLLLGPRTDAYSETVPAGMIISQDPAPGTVLKPASTVSIVVSKGRQPIAVPDLTGQPADTATAALGKLGFPVVEDAPVNSDTVPAGSVVSQDPRTGTLFKGDKVTIVVSKGPVLVAVPKTVGKQRGDAAQLLRQAGFTVAFNEVLGGFFGTVRGSDPAAGTMVRKGSTITLTIV